MNDIERLVTDESNAVGKDEKPLNSDEEKNEFKKFNKKILIPNLVTTVHHLENTKLIVNWLMTFSRLMLTIKKEVLVVIKTKSTAQAAGFDLKEWSEDIIADIGKIKVHISDRVDIYLVLPLKFSLPSNRSAAV